MTTSVEAVDDASTVMLTDLSAPAARDLTDQIRTGLEGVYQWIGPSPRIVDTVVIDYAATASVVARRAS